MRSLAVTALPAAPLRGTGPVRIATVALLAAALLVLMAVMVLEPLIRAAPADVLDGLSNPAALSDRVT